MLSVHEKFVHCSEKGQSQVLGDSSLQTRRCLEAKSLKRLQLYHGAGYIMSKLHLFLGLARELANDLLSISSKRYVTLVP